MPHRTPTNATDALRPPHELAHTNFEMVVRRLANDLAFGTDESLFVGSGLEFAQSRPYEPGDSIRQMDWRITARLGRPFVKQYETLKRIPMYIVVDTSSSMSVSSTVLTKHDLAIWIAAAMGLIGIRRLSPVAIAGAGGRATRLEPSLSQTDLWRVLEPLRAHGAAEHTTVGARLFSMEPQLARASLVIVMSDFHDPEAIAALRQTAQRHDVVAIHLQDHAERGQLRAGFMRVVEAETGREFLAGGRTTWTRPDDISRELTRAGVSYLLLRTDEPFIPALRHFLTTRAVLARGGR